MKIPEIKNLAPINGQFVCEDNSLFNFGDHLRALPINNARGFLVGGGSLNSFGERTSAGAETNYPIWPDGAFDIPPDAGVQMSVASTSANDSSAGSNIRSVEIHYLDANLDPQTETVILNGVTPVLTVATNIRFIQCTHIATYGTIQGAAGVITASYAGKSYSHIAVGEIRCTSAFRMVPRAKKMYIDGMIGSSVSGTAAARTVIKFVSNRYGNNAFKNPLILIPLMSIGVQDNAATFTLSPQPPFLEGDVVGFVHSSDKAATVSASFFGRLEPV